MGSDYWERYWARRREAKRRPSPGRQAPRVNRHSMCSAVGNADGMRGRRSRPR